MNFKELVMSNRTCRRYDNSKKVEMEKLVEFAELSRYIASGTNKQALRFVLINDEVGCERLYNDLGWAGYLKDWNGPIESERPTAYIVVVADTEYAKPMGEDLGIISQTITLAARSEGMASCIFKAFNPQVVAQSLELEEKYLPMIVVSVGYPVEEVVIDDIRVGEDIKYYRDENGVHHVPKIVLEDLIVKKNL